ncbi:MAG: DUF4738 domain-containing protein, partial [Mediterranea sp.]|nr:DUF4738 domain-containing protein [Mediterranea sp.]
MKVLRYIFLSALVPAMLTACGGKKGSTPQEAPVMATMDSTDAHGLRRLQDSKAETTLQFKGKEYHSKVVRTADESLPHVASEMGDTYLDNRITLRLTCGGKTVVDKAFTKQDFAAAVADADFLSKAILEGLVYDKT